MAASTEIQIANITNFEKIQNFLNDSAYKEILENSENFNTRLCIERRLRMPFLDPQTGVAQNHCALFMSKRQRLPGFRDGQIYTYPSSRWRKSKRQYLLHHQSYKAFQFRETHYQHHHHQGETGSAGTSDANSLTAAADNDSKDSHRNDEETKWYHDEMDLNHFEDFEEDFDSDLDFDESYSKPRRKKGKTARKSNADGISTPVKRGRGRGGGRGRGRGDGEGRRGRGSNASSTIPPPSLSTNNSSSASNPGDDIQMPVLTPEQKMSPGEDSSDGQPLSLLAGTATLSANSTNSTTGNTASAFNLGSTSSSDNNVSTSGSSSNNNTKTTSKASKQVRNDRGKAQPSPYCDFCLGDARENKKTNLPEELVSCSDCGRSGHPTCLQFTPNMIVSVKRYHWQCIECKYCSICGTSDNDDQLLFCDDCDRGYHMYCLQPPLTTPPEGSWSCKLCLEEFHGATNRRKRGRPKKLLEQYIYY
ncbi:zinc finger protein ubi-d4 isoform X2 [Condylostylus longicornis]|uniref:zinc finger protein ubi-d4 isoform X2 n=1 Tax=Condylostylus longicornis TaxID=2530218 RepID=UPI00244DE024|nr:zinc finger protein ubi-d4 isoform X2 [Condylostylus longicornis]